MKTPGMAVFKQQNVDDFYEIGEVLGRWVPVSPRRAFDEACAGADVLIARLQNKVSQRCDSEHPRMPPGTVVPVRT